MPHPVRLNFRVAPWFRGALDRIQAATGDDSRTSVLHRLVSDEMARLGLPLVTREHLNTDGDGRS